MKKLTILVILALASITAFAGGSLTRSVSDGQLTLSRTLDGNKLTYSACVLSTSAENTYSKCVFEVVKLSQKQVKAVQDEFQREQSTVQSMGIGSASSYSQDIGGKTSSVSVSKGGDYSQQGIASQGYRVSQGTQAR